MGEGARGREKDRYTRLACVAGAKRGGRGGGRKRECEEKERVREGSLILSPQSPSLFPFLAIPNPFGRLLLRLKDRLRSTP